MSSSELGPLMHVWSAVDRLLVPFRYTYLYLHT